MEFPVLYCSNVRGGPSAVSVFIYAAHRDFFAPDSGICGMKRADKEEDDDKQLQDK